MSDCLLSLSSKAWGIYQSHWQLWKNLINTEIISQRESARVLSSCCKMDAHGIFIFNMQVAAWNLSLIMFEIIFSLVLLGAVWLHNKTKKQIVGGESLV